MGRAERRGEKGTMMKLNLPHSTEQSREEKSRAEQRWEQKKKKVTAQFNVYTQFHHMRFRQSC